MFHIPPFTDECWSNEIHKCVCVYMCTCTQAPPRRQNTLKAATLQNPFTSPRLVPRTHRVHQFNLWPKSNELGVEERGNLPTRTIRPNLLYRHKQHQWNEAAVSISGKWKAVGVLCGTAEADITCNKSSEGHTYMHLCLHLLLNGLHSNTLTHTAWDGSPCVQLPHNHKYRGAAPKDIWVSRVSVTVTPVFALHASMQRQQTVLWMNCR